MNSPGFVERRIGQRFDFNLPVGLCDAVGCKLGSGFTQNVSSRGVFLFTDMPISNGAEIELTLRMPSEITLGESMRVRCKGRVMRVVSPVRLTGTVQVESHGKTPVDPTLGETKIGVAVCFSGYEYLSEKDEFLQFRPVSGLQGIA